MDHHSLILLHGSGNKGKGAGETWNTLTVIKLISFINTTIRPSLFRKIKPDIDQDSEVK